MNTILEKKFMCLTKFEKYQVLLNKISHRFLVTTKLFIGLKSLIVSAKHVGQMSFGQMFFDQMAP